MAAVYRFFNRRGRLLYIGLAVNARNRLRQHELEKPWWPEVATITLEHHEDWHSAAFAEIDAIRSEKPRYNRRLDRFVSPPASVLATTIR